MTDDEVVWLSEERRYAFLLRRGAYASEIYYYENGERYTTWIPNDEYVSWEEHAIGYE